jgi:hypothetical protein
MAISPSVLSINSHLLTGGLLEVETTLINAHQVALRGMMPFHEVEGYLLGHPAPITPTETLTITSVGDNALLRLYLSHKEKAANNAELALAA